MQISTETADLICGDYILAPRLILDLRVRLRALLLLAACLTPAHALDPRKSLTQYSRMVWTQQHGLPQDAIHAITQTSDGYLWLGTDEGLARFDGFEFVVFNKDHGDLPSNSITALAAAGDELWIGTSSGLTQYRDHRFRKFTIKDGLPDEDVVNLFVAHDGALWIVAGANLSRFQNGAFTNYAPSENFPATSIRGVREDSHHNLWVAAFNSLLKMQGANFVSVMDAKALGGHLITNLVIDRHDNIWAAGLGGVLERFPDGKTRQFGTRDGLPNELIRGLWEDRDGNIWAGTNGGIARLDGNRFVTPESGDSRDHDPVRCLFEDREGNLWAGSTSGLARYRDDVLTVYGKTEGLPSDEPNVLFQDHTGRIWVGFHDAGLMLFSPKDHYPLYTTRNGLPSDEVYSIHETRSGDLLIGARGGLVRMHRPEGGAGNAAQFTTLVPPDPLGRNNALDAIEDSKGRIWVAGPGGLFELQGTRFRPVVQLPPILVGSMLTVAEGPGGSIWAGSYGRGLWRVDPSPSGDAIQHFTTAEGLSSDQIRSLYFDPQGVLWIGTLGGGLNVWRNGTFSHYTAKDGLLSDNIAHVTDDGDSLWLSTTRGICRIPRRQLTEFSAHQRHYLDPINYGVDDGLRSAQCSPGLPNSGGGERTGDGRIWVTTTRGLAAYTPGSQKQLPLAPTARLVEVSVDGADMTLTSPLRLPPRTQRIEIRYTGIHLSAPERVRFYRRLDGLNAAWIPAGSTRIVNYNSLPHRSYRFTVKAEIPEGPATEQSIAFEVMPWFYEETWFRLLAAALLAFGAWMVYQVRVRQMRFRFALVLEERARLAREIHDTLAQGFVGISSQLDAVALCLPDETSSARKYLDLARRMARHSLTEARRSVMDLRASMLEGQDLASALESGARLWTAGSGVEIDMDVHGSPEPLPQDVEQHVLRIAQEAVANVLKHAGARKIWMQLRMEKRRLDLKIRDDGHGFEQDGVFMSLGGHFGLIGMRERAERLGGELRLASRLGEGTEVEVKVPLP